MKKSLIILLLSFSVFSQDLQIKNDEFSNQKIISCTTQKQNAFLSSSLSKELSITLTCTAKISENGRKFTYLSASIITSTIQCYSDHDGKIIFLFEDGEKLTLKQISKVKCDTNSIISYELSDYDLTKLLNNDIKKIRVIASDKYMEGEIKKNKKQLIKDTFVLFSLNINQ